MTSVFRAYDIRSIVDDNFNADFAYKLGKACGTYFLQNKIDDAIVAYDCRLSSIDFKNALLDGLLQTGVNIVNIGMVPTPLMYFSVRHLNRKAGIMVTASHNPKEYNGFKIWFGESTVYADELLYLRDLLEAEKFATGRGILTEHDIIPSYVKEVKKRLNISKKMKIVVDGSNGVGGELCCELLTSLGAEIVPMYCEPDGNFPNHEPDPSIEEPMKDLMAKVVELKADFGIGLDGDGDRIGVVDANGRLLGGDELLSIYANDLLSKKANSTVICDVKCSDCLFKEINNLGGNALMCKTGHSVIKSKMRETGALLAGEMSGHMFFAENWYGFDDAIFAAAYLYEILAKKSLNLVDLPKWEKVYNTKEIHFECSDEHKFKVIRDAQSHFGAYYKVNTLDGARVDFGDGFGLIRASNTKTGLVLRFEAKSLERLEEIKNIVFNWLEKNKII